VQTGEERAGDSKTRQTHGTDELENDECGSERGRHIDDDKSARRQAEVCRIWDASPAKKDANFW